jgi:hypothetical protein
MAFTLLTTDYRSLFLLYSTCGKYDLVQLKPNVATYTVDRFRMLTFEDE